MSDSINRRHFLGTTAATGLTLAVQAAEPGAADKVVVGIMGTGGRGTGLATSFQRMPGVEVAYVCDADQGRAERAAGAVQKISNRSPKIVADFRRILDDNAVQALVVATCNHWHAPASILACAAGKHVYVEKPVSYTAREGEMLLAAARKHKKHVQMGNQRRSYPKTIEAIELVRKGAIGRAYYAVSWYDSYRPTIGRGKAGDPPKGLDYDLWQGPAPRRPFRSNYLHYNWHWFWHWGNGELGNNGIHTIDLCRWALGVDYPIRVTSSGGRYHFDDDQETPDTQVVSYEFEGRKQIMWEGLSCTRQPSRPFFCMFHGDQGSMALGDSSYIIYDRAGKPTTTEKVVRGDDTHIGNFLAAVRNGTRLNSEIEEAHKSTLLCHLGNIAQRTGRTLQCDAKNGHILNDKPAMALWTREYDKNWEPRVERSRGWWITEGFLRALNVTPLSYSLDDVRKVIERHWGYRSFRPLQEQAMQASLTGRDSLVVMPTGGGKSLCYQAPAVLRPGTTVVVSPLISLMKDQVDGLRACGVSAVQIDSTLTSAERSAYEMDLLQGGVRLLFVSPERLAVPDFTRLLQRIEVGSFAIDEAHCISHWGHDFRPDYRQLNRIKELFPGAAIHAYTATATDRVRQDICRQLNLHDPLVLVGNFDRPNLTYRILPRLDEFGQILEVLERHKTEAGIIYCIRRADVDSLNVQLQSRGIRSLAYHAGLEKDERRQAQEAFAQERCDVIVATVAFGMGIDRSNVRFIIHAAMPKSIEHYQQETGRAGRDGLEAECVLLHGAGDFMTWKRIISRASDNGSPDPNFLASAFKHLDEMDHYCRGAVCRHRALVQYFGQKYTPPVMGEGDAEARCGACDLCLGDTEPVPEGMVIAQKILSCVARVEQRFGIGHVVSVLRGEDSERTRTLGHDKLSTFGLLRDQGKSELRDWIHQLMGQDVLVQEGDEYPILRLNEASWEVMRKQRTVRLIQPVRRKSGERARRSRADTESWEGVDKDLFETLRDLRRELANDKSVPPYIIFSDATLRDLARVRPSALASMAQIYGIGQNKLDQYGQQFLSVILQHCRSRQVPMDMAPPRSTREPAVPARASLKPPSGVKAVAFDLFRQGFVPVDVAHQTGRSVRAIMDDLADYVRYERVADISQWLDADTYRRVAETAQQTGTARLKPIFEALQGSVPYEEIRLVVAHLESRAGKLGLSEPET